jgi:hypothetical protein
VAPNTNVALSWSASSNGTNNAVSGYRVQRSTDGSSWANLVSSQTGRTLTVTSPSSNGSYYYRVIALAPHANSAASSSAVLKTVYTAPSAPSGVTVSPASVGASGSATLSWNASSNGTNNVLSGYRIDRSTDNVNWSTIVSSQTGRT